MKILLCNDDGVHAPGINALYKALHADYDLQVVAPDRDHSGASHSLTLDKPLRVVKAGEFYCVDGTPTDCVHLAITGLLETSFDMVLSGINAGSNLGDDVLYSGTVAAAVEGRFLGLPGLAVSLVGEQFQHYETAVAIVIKMLAHLQQHPLPGDTILNINVPDLPLAELKGLQVTRLGHRHLAEPVQRSKDPRGRDIYWVGAAGPEQDAGEGTDFYAINQGFASITPLQIDLTQHRAMTSLASWLDGITL